MATVTSLVQGNDGPAAAPFLGVDAVPLVGEEVFQRGQQETRESGSSADRRWPEMFAQEPREEFLRQVLRLVDFVPPAAGEMRKADTSTCGTDRPSLGRHTMRIGRVRPQDDRPVRGGKAGRIGRIVSSAVCSDIARARFPRYSILLLEGKTEERLHEKRGDYYQSAYNTVANAMGEEPHEIHEKGEKRREDEGQENKRHEDGISSFCPPALTPGAIFLSFLSAFHSRNSCNSWFSCL